MMSADREVDVLDTIAAVQEGDYEAIKNVLSNRIVSVNAKDHDHCTLLHWAAINNRVKIANLLIEYGAEHVAGGILQETPLQWALRKKFYAMVSLLIEKLHVDLRHKSTQGYDALHLACRLQDVNAVFMLLSYGANPNSTDGTGDTPLLYLVKTFYNGKESEQSPTALNNSLEMIRILVQFGADVTAQDSSDGNSIMHILSANKGADLSLSFFLYRSAVGYFQSLQNTAGVVPYAYAVQSDNRRMARFLFDMLIFNYFPYHTPTAVSALLVVAFFWIPYACGSLLMGSIYSVALYFAASYSLLQHQVYDHRPRYLFGMLIGAMLTLIVTFYYVITPRISSVSTVVSMSFILLTSYLGYFVHVTKPMTSKTQSKSDITKKIVESSPVDGTDEENDLLAKSHGKSIDGYVNSNATTGSQSQNKIVKDNFTGKIQILKSSSKDGESNQQDGDVESESGMKNGVRVRTVGPRVCGVCLSDKRMITYVNNTASNGKKAVANQGMPVISMATHCNYCKMCVVDQDHHCVFLGNCVGRGNRRAFFFFLVGAFFCCTLYFFQMKYVQYYHLCVQDMQHSWVSRLFRAEVDFFYNYASLFLLTWIVAAGGAMMFGLVAQGQLLFIGRETTLSNVIKKKYATKAPPNKKQMKNIYTFLRTGQYMVTYPKQDGMQVRESCCDHGHGHDHSHGPAAKKSDEKDASTVLPASSVKSDANEIQTLLSRIEKDMGIDPNAMKGILPPLVSGAQPVASASNKNVYDEEVGQGHNHSHDHGHSKSSRKESSEVYENDEFDTEFAESYLNTYYDRYYDDDEDDDGEGGDSPNSNSFYANGNGDDEEALLKSRRN